MTAQQAFWNWSLIAHSRTGAPQALIRLQDEFGLNANILLWCCWCAVQGIAVPDLALRKAADLVNDWSHDVTEPLRAVRRALKAPPRQADQSGAAALRERVKAVELEAEKLEQAMLESLAGGLASKGEEVEPLEEARRALVRYADLSGIAFSRGFSTLLLDDLARAIFGDTPMEATSQ